MSHHSISAIPKNKEKFPKEIVKKAKDFYYLFSQDLHWMISEEEIGLYYHGECFDLGGELYDVLDKKYISQNMVDVYHWICANAYVGSDCWNVCDFEYGPDSVEEFEKEVQSAI